MAISDTIIRAQNAARDMQQSIALGLINDIWREFLADVNALNASQDVNLVDGTREYDLPAALKRVLKVVYHTSSTARTDLVPVTLDELDQSRTGWRTDTTEGAPTEWYVDTKAGTSNAITQRKLGLLPTPGTTTSAGYPKVTVYYTTYTALALTSDVPDVLVNDLILRYGALMLHFRERQDLQQAEYYKALYEAEKTRNIASYKLLDRQEMVRLQLPSALGSKVA